MLEAFPEQRELVDTILTDGKVHNVSIDRIIHGIGFHPDDLPAMVKMYRNLFNNKNQKDGN